MFLCPGATISRAGWLNPSSSGSWDASSSRSRTRPGPGTSSATSCPKTSWPRRRSRPRSPLSSWRTPSSSRTRLPTTSGSSPWPRPSSRASGDSSCDADESRAPLRAGRPHRGRPGADGGRGHPGLCRRQGAWAPPHRGLPSPRRGRPARGDRRPGSAQDPRELLAPGPRGQRGVGSALPEDPGGGIQAEASPVRRIVVGISGASGVVYGIRLLELLRAAPGIETHLVLSDPAKRTIVEETDWAVKDVEALATHRHDNKDIGASIASGSFKTDGMVIAPCSVKAAASVAHCLADNLLTRAADVTLKEGRPLVMVVRETPLHLGHLRVLTALAEMGAVLLPPMPAFYNRPKQIDDLVTHTLARVLDRLGLPHTLVPEWQGTAPPPRGRG